jgi:hypothetical protein
MGAALAEKEGRAITLLQLEERRGREEVERRRNWESTDMPRLEKLKSSGGDYLKETLGRAYRSMETFDQIACAASSRVDCEYYVKIFDMATKDASVPEKKREVAKVLAEEFGRRMREDAIFERMYIINDLAWEGGSKEAVKEAIGLFKELRPAIEKLASFYMKDMDEKLGKNLASYITDPQVSKQIVAWNTIKDKIKGMGTELDEVSKNFESSYPVKFSNIIQTLASVRYYEEELAIAYARKSGISV